MGAKTIIRQKTIRYHHLDDIRVTEIITKVSLQLAIQVRNNIDRSLIDKNFNSFIVICSFILSEKKIVSSNIDAKVL